jgi:hypothetical protein
VDYDQATEDLLQAPIEETDASSQTLNYGIISCVFKFLGEQRRLWPGFMVVCVSCIIGGEIEYRIRVLLYRTG